MKTCFRDWSKYLPTNRLVWIVMGVGIVLRVVHYLLNYSLWLDEAMLSLGIINRSFRGLMAPTLDFNQAAPLGFLFVSKAITLIMGTSEFALRLFPLLCGVASVVLFYAVARLYLKPKAALFALALFAVAWRLVAFSFEAKQYSVDVLAALLVYLFTGTLDPESSGPRPSLLVGLAGAILVWFSHPVVFVLAGVGAALVLESLLARDWSRVAKSVLLFGVAGASFVAYYFLVLGRLAQNELLLVFNRWSGYFMPLTWDLSQLQWLKKTLWHVVVDPVCLSPYVAAPLWLIGAGVLFWRNWRQGVALVLPPFAALCASGLEKYPFYSRWVLFAVPGILIAIASGIQWIAEKRGVFKAAAVFLGFVLLAGPFANHVKRPAHPVSREEVRPVLKQLKGHWQEGDVIYVHYTAVPTFLYYSERLGIAREGMVAGVCIQNTTGWRAADGTIDDYYQQLTDLTAFHRVWFLFARTMRYQGSLEEELALRHLDRYGERIVCFRRNNASAYLYAFPKGAQQVGDSSRVVVPIVFAVQEKVSVENDRELP
ncbi:MAG: glycosyltransferase family 39 protein [candidate division KSB1 bacterium]|nr:glycosyltransferase family 39 protein [candidate division KSB1 bacterium]